MRPPCSAARRSRSAGHVGAIALTAASTIVLTRFLGVDDYGRFTVLTVFLLIGASLSEFGLNGTAIRWFASGERPEDVFASLIGLRLVLSSAAAVDRPRHLRALPPQRDSARRP